MMRATRKNKNNFIAYDPVKVTTKQQLLLECDDADIVYYGGAKGGGKSFGVIIKIIYKLFQEEIWEYIQKDGKTFIRKCKGIRQTTHRKFYAIIIRQNNYELEELKKICREILPKFGGKLKTQTPYVWIFPHIGSEVMITLIQVEKDLSKIQGQQYDFVAVDEICNYENPYDLISILRSCMRGSHKVGGRQEKNIRQLVLTGNPVGYGALEINQIFVEPYPLGGKMLNVKTPYGVQTNVTFRFIKALLMDNKYLLENDPSYLDNLFAFRKDLVMAYAFGRIDNSSGVFFDSFQPKHILRRDKDNTPALVEFLTNHHYTEDWVRVAGMDWGTRSPYCVLFGVRVTREFKGAYWHFKKDDIIVYKELYGKDPAQKTGGTGESIYQVIDKLKAIMSDREKEINFYIDTAMWNASGFGGDESLPFQMQRELYDDLSPEERAYQNDIAQNTVKSVGDAFESGMQTGGFYNTIKASSKAIIPSCAYIYSLFKEDKIWVVGDCVNLIKQLQSVKIDENNHEKPENKHNTEDHAIDALRYMMMTPEMKGIEVRNYLKAEGSSMMPNQCRY